MKFVPVEITLLTFFHFQTYGGLLLRIRQVYERHLLHLKRDLNFEAKEKQR